ncbi:hypothetical protein EJB05_17158, partial [Eragrostis curvula]
MASTAEELKQAAGQPSRTEEEDGDMESWPETDEDVASGEEDAYVDSSSDTDEEAAARRWKNVFVNHVLPPAVELGNGGVILVLLETPSGFALFSYDGVKLLEPDACQNIWADFADDTVAKLAVWLQDFQTFEDKLSAINLSTGVSDALANMIKKHIVPGQRLAVENKDYRKTIETSLKIPCMYGPAVEELMWGLKIQMPYLVPAENSEMEKDIFPMSEGMKFLLNFHCFKFKPDMMVTRRIIKMAGTVHACDRCVNKHSNNLHSVAEHLKEISHIDTRDWDLMKIATALKLICYPNEKVKAPRSLFRKQEMTRLWNDRPKYDGKILKMPLLVVYDEINMAREARYKAACVLCRLLRRATKAHEVATDNETSPDGEKERSEHRGFGGEAASVVDELTECNYKLSEERKKRQIPPTLASIDALKRYTRISSHPLHRTNEPGILSMHIHPSKVTLMLRLVLIIFFNFDVENLIEFFFMFIYFILIMDEQDIVATGGIDTNAVLFDRPSGQILSTLTGHSKKITSLKFVNRDELFITGSADKTVRIWQGREDGNYSCIHTLKDHTAEVGAVTVHATQKYFVTASKDHSWCFYDISTGFCLTRVCEASEQEGYTSASFHPDGLILGTGTSASVVKIWDVKTQSSVGKLKGHVGPVTAMSFSENGYLLATASLGGVRVWDVRKLRYLWTISPYFADIPTNAVEFDLSGRYLAIGGSDISVYNVDKDPLDFIKKLPDLSRKGKVTSLKFGVDAKYIAVGSMDHKLRIFGLPGDEQMDE